MDTLYSLGLLVAIISAGLGTALTVVLALDARIRGRKIAGLRLTALACGMIALVAGTGSAAIHLAYGHGSESVAPMQFFQFVTQHKAYWLVLVLCILTFFSISKTS
jgi:hypothetical protein